MSIVVFIDGACEPHNPGGNMGWGAVVEIDGKRQTFFGGKPKHPDNTNNIAEYEAAVRILKYLIKNDLCDEPVTINTDSNLIAMQMARKWKIKNGAYVALAKEALELIGRFKRLQFKWIPREENELADELSKKGSTSFSEN